MKKFVFKSRIFISLFMLSIFFGLLHSQYQYVGNITGYNQSGNDINFQCGTPLVRVTVCKEDMIRVRLAPSGTFQARFSDEPYMVVKYSWPSVSYTLTDGGSYYQIETSKLIMRVNKSPCRISFYNKSLTLLNQDYPSNNMGWNPSNGRVWLGKTMQTGEQFYGLGEQFCPDNAFGVMSYRGYRLELWNQDSQCEDYRPSYTNIPWIVSTNKYGIFFHNPCRIFVGFGTDGAADRYYFEAYGGELDYYFIYGGTDKNCYKVILDRYTELTGRPEMPPNWAFGLAVIGDVNLALSNWRNTGIPGDMLGIDIGWYNQCGSFQFASDGQTTLNNCHAQNFKLWLWEVPLIVTEASTYNTGATNGYFCKNTSGGVYQISMWPGTGGYVDFTKEAARAWYRSLHDVKGSDGVPLNPKIDCFKTDDGEYAPDSTGFLFSEGLYNGSEFHNPYGLVYNGTVWEAVRERFGRGFCLHRASYAGGQRYCLFWGGDNGSSFHEGTIYGKSGMDNCIRAFIGLAWSAFTYHTMDLGGCDPTDEMSYPNDELFQRWICQFGAFIPFSLINDYRNAGGRVPWKYSTAMQQECARYYKIHYRLFPYFYSYAYESHVNGTPIVRPMLMEFPDDPKCEQIGGRPNTTIDGQTVMAQFMTGSYIMVCPVVDSGATTRRVYLPQGRWTNYWDETVVTGPGIITAPAPVDTIPVYIREGAIIPMIDERNYINQYPNNRITLDIYPSAGLSEFTMYEDDGATEQYKSGSYATTLFQTQGNDPVIITIGARQGTYTGMPSSRYYRLQVHNQNTKPQEVRRDSTNLLTEYASLTQLDAATEGWFYDSSKKIVYVKPRQDLTGSFSISLQSGTAGQATHLDCVSSKTNMTADGQETATITATAKDSNNYTVTTFNGSVSFNLSGPGTLVGTNPVNAVNGIATITYRAGTQSGTAIISATSSGLTGDSCQIILSTSGSGTLNPVLTLNTYSLDFGEVPFGTSATLEFTVSNTGGGTLTGTISDDKEWIDVQPQNFSITSGGSSAIINVTVDNEILGEREGNFEGTITINSNGGNAEIQVTLTATCVLVKPNPYNPDKEVLEFFGTGIVPGKTTIRIYTLSGELIWENSKNQGISDRIIWDGNDLKGRKVLSGIYIYTYESEKEKGSGKITVIRK